MLQINSYKVKGVGCDTCLGDNILSLAVQRLRIVGYVYFLGYSIFFPSVGGGGGG